MCERFGQSGRCKDCVRASGTDTAALDELAVTPLDDKHRSGRLPLMLYMPDWERQVCPYRLGLSQPERGRCKEKTVIDARVEKVLTGRISGTFSARGG